jgi:adenosylcobinamide-phosphate synthase
VLIGLPPPALALLLVAGIGLDLLLGETRRWHPLVGFGRLAGLLERRLNAGGARLVRGAGAWMLAVLPLSLLSAVLADAAGLSLHAVLLYFCIGLRSLRDHTLLNRAGPRMILGAAALCEKLELARQHRSK